MSSSFQFIFLCSIDQSKVKSTDKKWRNGPAPSKVSSIDQWWIRVHYKRSGTVCYCPIISCKFLLTARIGSVSVDFIPICVWMTWTYFFAQSFLWHPCLKSTFAKSNFEYCMYSGVWNIGVALYIIKFWENT